MLLHRLEHAMQPLLGRVAEIARRVELERGGVRAAENDVAQLRQRDAISEVVNA
jgi:hypothetical protein